MVLDMGYLNCEEIHLSILDVWVGFMSHKLKVLKNIFMKIACAEHIIS